MDLLGRYQLCSWQIGFARRFPCTQGGRLQRYSEPRVQAPDPSASSQAKELRTTYSTVSLIFVQHLCIDSALLSFAASVVVSVTYGKRINTVDEWVVKQHLESEICKYCH